MQYVVRNTRYPNGAGFVFDTVEQAMNFMELAKALGEPLYIEELRKEKF